MQLERKFFTQDDLPVCEDCYKVSLDHDDVGDEEDLKAVAVKVVQRAEVGVG